MRAFNKMKEELSAYRSNQKGKDGEVNGLQSQLTNKITECESLKVENSQLQAMVQALEQKLKKLIDDNKDIALLH